MNRGSIALRLHCIPYDPFEFMKRYLGLITMLCLAGLSTAQSTCYGNVCFSCPDCSIFQPSYSSIGNSAPTVADLKATCLCAGCADITKTQCLATDAKTGEMLSDDTPVPIGNGISMDGMTGSTGMGASSGILYECPSGCRSITYSPVIFGSEISVNDILSTGCRCSGCPGTPFPQCKIYRDGQELGPDAVLTATEAMSAQRIDTAESSAVSTTGSLSTGLLVVMATTFCFLS